MNHTQIFLCILSAVTYATCCNTTQPAQPLPQAIIAQQRQEAEKKSQQQSQKQKQPTTEQQQEQTKQSTPAPTIQVSFAVGNTQAAPTENAPQAKTVQKQPEEVGQPAEQVVTVRYEPQPYGERVANAVLGFVTSVASMVAYGYISGGMPTQQTPPPTPIKIVMPTNGNEFAQRIITNTPKTGGR